MVRDITNFQLIPLENAQFIHTARATYEQNKIPKSWEIVQAHDSVAILIYHTQKRAFILVQQFRPAVYTHNEEGITLELCAGIVDKTLTLDEIAQEEVAEECGYDVPLSSLERITSFYTSVGFAGSKQTLYYAEVDESIRSGEGGGVDSELIEVVTIGIKKKKKILFDETVVKTPGLMFAFYWWFENKANL